MFGCSEGGGCRGFSTERERKREVAREPTECASIAAGGFGRVGMPKGFGTKA